ncbi:MAG: hypothetical protein MZV64_20040 [Ignavibacteriales bacterium]|nr:hypothetical protein [Ignavibacteriales bacterium]
MQPFSQQKAVDEDPAYVVFNGAVGSLAGENSLKAKKRRDNSRCILEMAGQI